MKVIVINASQSVEAEEQKKYDQMTQLIWDETHENLGCVLLALLAHAQTIKVGWNHSLEELVKALLSHIKFPLGSAVKCTLTKQQVRSVLYVLCCSIF